MLRGEVRAGAGEVLADGARCSPAKAVPGGGWPALTLQNGIGNYETLVAELGAERVAVE